MSGVTKLGLALVLVFALALLALSAELLYVLFYRRRFRRAASSADPELSIGGSEGGPASKELLLYFLCWKNQSRIEPAGAAAEAPSAKPSPSGAGEGAEEGDELARWRAVCYGPSRVLYTIKEEEEREAAESDVVRGCGRSSEVEEEEETPFSTPCASPPFYTPSSSPPRAAAPGSGEAEPLSLVVEHV